MVRAINWINYYRNVSSVGLEHYLDRVGVTGSSPLRSTYSWVLFTYYILHLFPHFPFNNNLLLLSSGKSSCGKNKERARESSTIYFQALLEKYFGYRRNPLIKF